MYLSSAVNQGVMAVSRKGGYLNTNELEAELSTLQGTSFLLENTID